MKIFKTLKKLVATYVQTQIEIVEIDQQIILPKWVYLAIFFLFLTQNLSYIISNDDYPDFRDQKMESYLKFTEITTITYPIYQLGNMTLLLGWFFLVQSLMFIYLIYVGLLCYLKSYKQKVYDSNKKWIEKINQVINFILTIYPTMLFIPCIESCSIIFNCARVNSYIQVENSEWCIENQFMLYSLSLFGLMFSLIINLLVFYFYRNYSFQNSNNYNMLIRQQSPSIVLQIFCSFILVISSYFIEFSKVIKYVAALFIGIILLYDQIIHSSYNNLIAQKIQTIMIGIYITFLIIFDVWLLIKDTFQDANLFYMTLIISSVFSGYLVTIISKYHQNIIRLDNKSFNKYFKLSSQYLEQMYRLGMEFQNSREDKFLLFEVINHHKCSCNYLDCYCKKIQLKEFNEKNTLFIIQSLIDSLFQQYLNSDEFKKNPNQKEKISLKYISFLWRCLQNPFLAYYKLQVLQNENKRNQSYFYKNVVTVIQKQLLFSITLETAFRSKNQYNSTGESTMTSNESNSGLLNVNSSLLTEKAKVKLIQQALTFLEKKKQLYISLKKGYKDIQLFAEDAVKIGKEGDGLKKTISSIYSLKNKNKLQLQTNVTLLKVYFILIILFFHKQLKKLNKNAKTNKDSQYNNFKLILIQLLTNGIDQKESKMSIQIKSILSSVIFKQIQESYKIEERIKEIKLRNGIKIKGDLSEEIQQANRMHSLELSLVQNKGELILQNSQKLAILFGHSQKDSQRLQLALKDLMPESIANIHDYFIDNMMRRGHCKFVNRGISTYAINKDGYLFPVSIQVDVQQGIKDDFRLVAQLIAQDQQQCEIIQFDEFGNIEGSTEEITKTLLKQHQLGSHSLIKMKTNMKSLIKTNMINSLGVIKFTNIFLIIPRLLSIISEFNKQDQISNENIQGTVHKIISTKEMISAKISTNIHFLSQQFNKIFNNTYINTQETLQSISDFLKENQKEWQRDFISKQYNIRYSLGQIKYQYYQNNTNKYKIQYTLSIFDLDEIDITDQEQTFSHSNYSRNQQDSNDILNNSGFSSKNENVQILLNSMTEQISPGKISPKKIIQQNQQNKQQNVFNFSQFNDKWISRTETKQIAGEFNFDQPSNIANENSPVDSSEQYINLGNIGKQTQNTYKELLSLNKLENDQTPQSGNLNSYIGSQQHLEPDSTQTKRQKYQQSYSINPINYFQEADHQMSYESNRFQPFSVSRFHRESECQINDDEIDTPVSVRNNNLQINIENSLQNIPSEVNKRSQNENIDVITNKSKHSFIKQMSEQNGQKLKDKSTHYESSYQKKQNKKLGDLPNLTTIEEKMKNDLNQKSHDDIDKFQQFDITSNFSSSSNQRYQQNKIYKMILRDFPPSFEQKLNLTMGNYINNKNELDLTYKILLLHTVLISYIIFKQKQSILLHKHNYTDCSILELNRWCI